MDWTDIGVIGDIDLGFQLWADGLGRILGAIVLVVIVTMLITAVCGEWGSLTIRRRFWCPLVRRDVQVDFTTRGMVPRLASVRRCSAFEDGVPTCARRCLDAAFRNRWDPALPVLTHGPRAS